MPFLELIDETLDINSTENYELSVEISSASLSFCIFDTIRNKFILLRSAHPDTEHKYSEEVLGEMINKDEFLTKDYKIVNIIAPSLKFTLVPSALFEPGKIEEYFTFNHILPENEVILVNKIYDPDSHLVFSQPLYLNNLINNKWPDSETCHHLKPFLKFAANSVSDHEDLIHIHIEQDFFNLIFHSNKTLKLSNTFIYKNASDILYYTLNIVRNLGVKKEVTIILSGQVERNNEIYSGLSSYIKNVRFAEPKGNFTFSYVMNDTDLFRYINLISTVNCG